MARPSRFRIPRKTMLIVCEGETEKIYFENLKATERKAEINIKPELSKNRTDCLGIVEKAISHKDDYDQVWCVFDLDTAHKNASQYRKAVERAKSSKIKTVESYPCFEIWFLLHFVYTTRSFDKCGQVIQLLKKHIKDYSKNQGYHMKKNFYSNLRPHLLKAMDNSLKLERYNSGNAIVKGPRSGVYKIIEEVLPGIRKNERP